MRVGTKSVLYGQHCFLIHPWFVALAWWKLFGFPIDPRLWIAFFVHDLGYIGKPNMDGVEGETHVELGANIMHWFGNKWRDLCLYHSRFYAARDGSPISKLCIADKYACAITPTWLQLFLGRLSGEIWEYRQAPKYEYMNSYDDDLVVWWENIRGYLFNWVTKELS